VSRLEAGGIFVWAGIGIAIESLCLGMECNGSDERTDGWMVDGWMAVRIRMRDMLRMREVKMKSRLRHA